MHRVADFPRASVRYLLAKPNAIRNTLLSAFFLLLLSPACNTQGSDIFPIFASMLHANCNINSCKLWLLRATLFLSIFALQGSLSGTGIQLRQPQQTELVDKRPANTAQICAGHHDAGAFSNVLSGQFGLFSNAHNLLFYSQFVAPKFEATIQNAVDISPPKRLFPPAKSTLSTEPNA